MVYFQISKKIANDIDEVNEMTEVSFFSQEKTKKILNQRKNVDGITSHRFMQDTLRTLVLSALKREFVLSLANSKDQSVGRIFFYYEFYQYNLYLEEHGMKLIDCIDNFGVINTNFLYIEDVAFFSSAILNNITQSFIPFLNKEPSLSGIPFTKRYLCASMLSRGFLNPHIRSSTLEAYESNRELYEDDFNALYDGISNEELMIALKNNLISEMPKQKKEYENAYFLNHENENGIIKEEFGKESEQNRVSFDVDVSNQVDELVGCPI